MKLICQMCVSQAKCRSRVNADTGLLGSAQIASGKEHKAAGVACLCTGVQQQPCLLFEKTQLALAALG